MTLNVIFSLLIATVFIPWAYADSKDLAENGQALEGVSCDYYSIDMHLWLNNLSSERQEEIHADLNERGLQIGNSHQVLKKLLKLSTYSKLKLDLKPMYEKLVGDLQKPNSNNRITQTVESIIEMKGLEMGAPVIKSRLDIVFSEAADDSSFRESDLLICKTYRTSRKFNKIDKPILSDEYFEQIIFHESYKFMTQDILEILESTREK